MSSSTSLSVAITVRLLSCILPPLLAFFVIVLPSGRCRGCPLSLLLVPAMRVLNTCALRGRLSRLPRWSDPGMWEYCVHLSLPLGVPPDHLDTKTLGCLFLCVSVMIFLIQYASIAYTFYAKHRDGHWCYDGEQSRYTSCCPVQ